MPLILFMSPLLGLSTGGLAHSLLAGLGMCAQLP